MGLVWSSGVGAFVQMCVEGATPANAGVYRSQAFNTARKDDRYSAVKYDGETVRKWHVWRHPSRLNVQGK
jgi:hypothetical protein